MPTGLFVNEIERKPIVRNYLIKEAKKGYDSTMNDIKDCLCLHFLLNTYKLAITEKLSEFPTLLCDTAPSNECLNKFIQICEHILQKTCDTLTKFKKIFNLSTQLNPSVSAIMRTLLKLTDENPTIQSANSSDHDDIFNKLNENLKKKKNSGGINQLSNNNSTNNSKKKQVDGDSLDLKKSSVNNNKTLPVLKNMSVVLERLNDTVIEKSVSKKNNSSELSSDDIEENNMLHTLDFIDDISSDEKTVFTRKTRSLKKINKNKVL